jgi:Tn3 transposase DDE domain
MTSAGQLIIAWCSGVTLTISMLALHLIQNCTVYINTLMIQKVLAQPHWQGRLTPRDYAALTSLIWEHVNPYGRFDLDMNARLALLYCWVCPYEAISMAT